MHLFPHALFSRNKFGDTGTVLYAPIAVIFILVFICVILFYYKRRKWRKQRREPGMNFSHVENMLKEIGMTATIGKERIYNLIRSYTDTV